MKKLLEEYDFLKGELILFDKPKTWTSFDIVNKVRMLTRAKKVGHAGTLDPLATGLLLLCTGKLTREIDRFQADEKEYEAEFCLGATTRSYDTEYPPENFRDVSGIDEITIRNAMLKFTGDVMQVPPVFSAMKVGGKRAYKAARKGRTPEMTGRMVHINEFEIIKFESPQKVLAKIVCGKGTYIRSLVHDLGQELGVGAYIRELRRTRIGEYRIENAWEIGDFATRLKSLREQQAPIP